MDTEIKTMFSLFHLPSEKFVNLYAKPINMQWGVNKLKQICLNEMNRDPEKGGIFLFFNRAMSKLKLFFIDDEGPQTMTKVLFRGGFVLPVPAKGEVVIRLEKTKLKTIFRC